jgi:hypothetical protein
MPLIRVYDEAGNVIEAPEHAWGRPLSFPHIRQHQW